MQRLHSDLVVLILSQPALRDSDRLSFGRTCRRARRICLHFHGQPLVLWRAFRWLEGSDLVAAAGACKLWRRLAIRTYCLRIASVRPDVPELKKRRKSQSTLDLWRQRTALALSADEIIFFRYASALAGKRNRIHHARELLLQAEAFVHHRNCDQLCFGGGGEDWGGVGCWCETHCRDDQRPYPERRFIKAGWESIKRELARRLQEEREQLMRLV